MKKILFPLLIAITIEVIFGISIVYPYDDYIDFVNSQHLYQRQAGMATCGEHLSLITTIGVGPCLFIILYDTEKMIGVAAHWDDETKSEDIERFFEIFEHAKSNFDNIEAYLVGGWDSSVFVFPKIIATFIENALLERNITKINKDHLFEKSELPNSPYLDTDDLPKYMFFGLGFDVCSGTLKLTDAGPTKEVAPGPMPDLCLHNQLKEDVPHSGCPLEFIKPRKIKKIKMEI